MLDGGVECERDGAGLVEASGRRVQLGVAVDQRLELAVFWATLAHKHLVVTQEHLRVNHSAALWADAARELIKDVVHVALRTRNGRDDGVGMRGVRRFHNRLLGLLRDATSDVTADCATIYTSATPVAAPRRCNHRTPTESMATSASSTVTSASPSK